MDKDGTNHLTIEDVQNINTKDDTKDDTKEDTKDDAKDNTKDNTKDETKDGHKDKAKPKQLKPTSLNPMGEPQYPWRRPPVDETHLSRRRGRRHHGSP